MITKAIRKRAARFDFSIHTFQLTKQYSRFVHFARVSTSAAVAQTSLSHKAGRFQTHTNLLGTAYLISNGTCLAYHIAVESVVPTRNEKPVTNDESLTEAKSNKLGAFITFRHCFI